MKTLLLVVAGLLVFGASARDLHGDWVILRDGAASRVTGFELTDRTVDIVTLNGKPWSVARAAVDMNRMLAVNGMAGEERFSPGWPRAIPDPAPTLASTVVPEPARIAGPPAEPEHVPLVEPPAAPTELVQRVEPERDILRPTPVPEVFSPPTSSTGRYRVAVFLNGALGTESLQFNEQRNFTLFREQAQVATGFSDAPSRGAEVGAVLMIKGRIGVSASLEMFRSDRTASYSARLPHPFFYDSFRAIDETRSGLAHEERAAHLAMVVSQSLGRRLSLDLFAGPSVFDTRTEILTDFLYDEAFPFDDVLSLGPVTRVIEERPLGFHAGANATYRLFGAIGLNINVRYSRARLRLDSSERGDTELDLGGLRLGAGVKFLFP